MSAPIHRSRPGSVLVAAAVWVLLGGVLIAAWLSGDPGRVAADQGSLDRITGALGDSAVAGSGDSGVEILLLLLGIALLLLGAGLLARARWVLWPLALAGVAGVIVLALGGRWQTLVAMPLVLLGTIALMTSGSRQYLGP